MVDIVHYGHVSITSWAVLKKLKLVSNATSNKPIIICQKTKGIVAKLYLGREEKGWAFLYKNHESLRMSNYAWAGIMFEILIEKLSV